MLGTWAAGPARTGHAGLPLDRPSISADGQLNPDATVLDPSTGQPRAWDWQASGTVEMNCFLGHMIRPDNDARIEELAAGRFAWSAAATLAQTGIVKRTADTWEYDRGRFSDQGTVGPRCAATHRPDAGELRTLPRPDPRGPRADEARSVASGSVDGHGQVACSPASGCPTRESIWPTSRTWAGPGTFMPSGSSVCTDLPFLHEQPGLLHQFDGGWSRSDGLRSATIVAGRIPDASQPSVCQGNHGAGVPRRDISAARCGAATIATRPKTSHDWLPYREAHFAALSCEACHIPPCGGPGRREHRLDAALPAR